MTLQELKHFLLHQMSMSHIYQPLVIRMLLENSGDTTIREIAKEFLAYDEAQVDYYIKIVKRWPKITLARHGIIKTSKKGHFELNVPLTLHDENERRELIEICNQQIREYIANYKGIIGDYRYNPEDLSSGSVRYLVLKLANGRCALCGASIKDTPIDIDHIRPRGQGGSNDLTNLQALCYRCNRAKRDRDAQDFRNYGTENSIADCAFCNLGTRIISSYNTAHHIADAYAVTPHHSLIIPKRHVTEMSALVSHEVGDMFQLAKVVKNNLRRLDPTIAGFKVGFNDGEAAGQTILHTHLHIIPRRLGDVPNPRGGIRGVIPGRPSY